MRDPLCEYEVKVLRCAAGQNGAWLVLGAAMSAALETLKARKLVHMVNGAYVATAAGKEYLAGAPRTAVVTCPPGDCACGRPRAGCVYHDPRLQS